MTFKSKNSQRYKSNTKKIKQLHEYFPNKFLTALKIKQSYAKRGNMWQLICGNMWHPKNLNRLVTPFSPHIATFATFCILLDSRLYSNVHNK